MSGKKKGTTVAPDAIVDATVTDGETTLPVRIQKAAPPAATAGADNSPSALIRLALEHGHAPEALGALLDVQERLRAIQAFREYTESMTAFKEDAPLAVLKNADGQHGNKYAKLDHIVATLRPHLIKHGLDVTWKTARLENGNQWVQARCVHIGGHVETSELDEKPDTGPGRSAVQALGSTISYLKRYTLEAVLGIVTSDTDDDGNMGRPRQPSDTDDDGNMGRPRQPNQQRQQQPAPSSSAKMPRWKKYDGGPSEKQFQRCWEYSQLQQLPASWRKKLAWFVEAASKGGIRAGVIGKALKEVKDQIGEEPKRKTKTNDEPAVDPQLMTRAEILAKLAIVEAHLERREPDHGVLDVIRTIRSDRTASDDDLLEIAAKGQAVLDRMGPGPAPGQRIEQLVDELQALQQDERADESMIAAVDRALGLHDKGRLSEAEAEMLAQDIRRYYQKLDAGDESTRSF